MAQPRARVIVLLSEKIDQLGIVSSLLHPTVWIGNRRSEIGIGNRPDGSHRRLERRERRRFGWRSILGVQNGKTDNEDKGGPEELWHGVLRKSVNSITREQELCKNLVEGRWLRLFPVSGVRFRLPD